MIYIQEHEEEPVRMDVNEDKIVRQEAPWIPKTNGSLSQKVVKVGMLAMHALFDLLLNGNVGRRQNFSF